MSVMLFNQSKEFLTKVRVSDWDSVAKKHPSRSAPGQIDEAYLEKLYRKMDAALQVYCQSAGRDQYPCPLFDTLSQEAARNFSCLSRYTNDSSQIGENISLFVRKWGGFPPIQDDYQEYQEVVLGGFLSNDCTIDPSSSLKKGDIVVFSSGKNLRCACIKEIQGSSYVLDIGEHFPITWREGDLYLLEPQPKLIERQHPEMRAFPVTESAFDESHSDFTEGFGKRTRLMRDWMMGFKENYQQSSNGEVRLKVNGVIYTPVTGGLLNLSQTPVLSCGSNSTREIIALNPSTSQLLNAHYKCIAVHLRAKAGQMSEGEILDYVKDYIRNYMLFNSSEKDLDKEIKTFLSQRPYLSLKYQSKNELSVQVPLVPIDYFIEKGIGVCRHHALISAYILDRLTYEDPPLLSGAVQCMRDNVSGGAHVWTTFMSNAGAKWHVDTLWDIIHDFSDPSQQKTLEFKYGKEAINNQINRSQNALVKSQEFRNQHPKSLFDSIGPGAKHNPFMVALVRLHRLVADGASVSEMRKEMKKLSNEDRINIHYHVWELHGRPVDPNDKDWGNTHLFDNILFFDQAVQQALKAKFNGIPKDQQNQIFGEVFRLAGSPISDDSTWGEHHAFDDIPRLATAMAIVLQ